MDNNQIIKKLANIKIICNTRKEINSTAAYLKTLGLKDVHGYEKMTNYDSYTIWVKDGDHLNGTRANEYLYREEKINAKELLSFIFSEPVKIVSRPIELIYCLGEELNQAFDGLSIKSPKAMFKADCFKELKLLMPKHFRYSGVEYDLILAIGATNILYLGKWNDGVKD